MNYAKFAVSLTQREVLMMKIQKSARNAMHFSKIYRITISNIKLIANLRAIRVQFI